MASTTSTTNPVKSLGLPEIKDAGVKSLGIGIAATLTVFAVQVAFTAGKSLLNNSKALAESLKA